MPRPILLSPSRARTRTITCLGDSLTGNYAWGVPYTLMWPEVLAGKLRALSPPCLVKARNFGHSGNTTGPYSGEVHNPGDDLIGRLGNMTTWEIPEIAILWGGVNDPGNGIAGYVTDTVQAGSTAGIVNVANGGQFHAGQAVVIDGVLATVASIAGNALTLASALPNAPVTGRAVQQGTQANLQWMIGQLKAAGVARCIVLNTQYLNYSGAAGDTLTTPFAAYNTLRPFQAAAVSSYAGDPAIAVVLADLYGYLRGLIQAGAPVVYNGVSYPMAQGNVNWHVADGNQHLNALGNELVARFLLSVIQAQPGWVAALQS
jgi:lysophospholipase L1-like esterase